MTQTADVRGASFSASEDLYFRHAPVAHIVLYEERLRDARRMHRMDHSGPYRAYRRLLKTEDSPLPRPGQEDLDNSASLSACRHGYHA